MLSRPGYDNSFQERLYSYIYLSVGHILSEIKYSCCSIYIRVAIFGNPSVLAYSLYSTEQLRLLDFGSAESATLYTAYYCFSPTMLAGFSREIAAKICRNFLTKSNVLICLSCLASFFLSFFLFALPFFANPLYTVLSS